MEQQFIQKLIQLNREISHGEKPSSPWLALQAPTIKLLKQLAEASIIDNHQHVLAHTGRSGKESFFHGFIINYCPPTCELVILNRMGSKEIPLSDTWKVCIEKPVIPLEELLVKDLNEGTLVIVADVVAITGKITKRSRTFHKMDDPQVTFNKSVFLKVWAANMNYIDIELHEKK